jgi:hypothetical protein
MTHLILPSFIALVPSMLWVSLLGPLLLRSPGVPVPLNWQERKHMQMRLDQSVLLGVIGWGVGVMIFHMTSVCIRWSLYRTPADQPTIWRFAEVVLQWTLAGIVFGLFTAYPKRKQNED